MIPLANPYLPELDTFDIKRPVATSDSEGNAFNGWTTVGNGTGTYGSASSRDQWSAEQRGESVDAFVATLNTNIRIGDVLANLRGGSWTVISVKDVRLHYRVGLRAIAGGVTGSDEPIALSTPAVEGQTS